MCVNNLPKVVTWQCPSAESNLRPWVTSGSQVQHVTIRLPSHKRLQLQLGSLQLQQYNYNNPYCGAGIPGAGS